ncbi:hypothetical protein ZIOFF_006427 [Zingiber officinale]|uniref:Uncharacterized protein n=1 Tax=Zingiber officinale TaxID=94328 RepID=A0A8J5HNP6_ZINOF|nr:hypothetical protein ZIOFF_006427 [Zingiber officinale]
MNAKLAYSVIIVCMLKATQMQQSSNQQTQELVQQQQMQQNTRKRKTTSSGPANSTGTGNTAAPSANSPPSTPSIHTPGDGVSMAGNLQNANTMSKSLMMYGTDKSGRLASSSHLDDLEHFGDVGSLDDNVESFLSNDDGDGQDIFAALKSTAENNVEPLNGFSFNDVSSMQAGSNKVVCCNFSTDGKLLASAGHDKKVVVWNMESLQTVSSSPEHSHIITDVCFRPNSTQLATSSFDKTVRLWSASEQPAHYRIRYFGMSCAQATPRSLPSLSSPRLGLGQPHAAAPLLGMSCAHARLVGLPSLCLLHDLGLGSPTLLLHWLLGMSCAHATLACLLSLPLVDLGLDSPVLSLHCLTCLVHISGLLVCQVFLLQDLGLDNAPRTAGPLFSMSHALRTCPIVNITLALRFSIHCLRSFTGHSSQITSLDFHPKETDIFCSCDDNGEIRYWNASQYSCTQSFKGGGTVQVRFQPRSGQFLAAAADNMISIFDVETHTNMRTLQGHKTAIQSICWDLNGSTLASVSQDLVKIWSTRTWDCISELSSNGNQFHSCIFHPRYTQILVIGGYQSLELWNRIENQTMTVQAHEGVIAALAQSSFTGMIASASHDKSVKLWK